MKRTVFLLTCITTNIFKNAQPLKSINQSPTTQAPTEFTSTPKLLMGIYNHDTLYTTNVRNKSITDSGLTTYYSSTGKVLFAPKYIPSTIQCCCGPCPGNAHYVGMEQIKKIERSIKKIGLVDNQYVQKHFNPNGSEILLYDQPNYQGHQLIINAEGDFDLTTRKGWNNAISSVQIPCGYFLTSYDINPYNEKESVYAEIGSKTGIAISVANFKKLPAAYYHTPGSPDYEPSDKVHVIDFDKKTSFINVLKIK